MFISPSDISVPILKYHGKDATFPGKDAFLVVPELSL